MDIARMEPEGYLTTTVPPIKQTNKQERTEAEAWKQILEKRVSKFFNKATAPVNRYVKFQKLSSFKKCLVFCRNSIESPHEFWLIQWRRKPPKAGWAQSEPSEWGRVYWFTHPAQPSPTSLICWDTAVQILLSFATFS